VKDIKVGDDVIRTFPKYRVTGKRTVENEDGIVHEIELAYIQRMSTDSQPWAVADSYTGPVTEVLGTAMWYPADQVMPL
jgi:hypothetical protein